MDEFLKHILSSSSWVDVSGAGRASFDGSTGGTANCMPSGSMGVLEGISQQSSMSLMPSSCVSENLEGQGQISNKISGQIEKQQELEDPVIASPMADQVQHNGRSPTGSNVGVQGGQESARLSAGGSVVLQLSTPCSVSPHGGSSQVLPAVGGTIRAGIELPGSSSRGNSGSEASGFQQCQEDTHSQSPTESFWSESYMAGVSPLPTILGQGKSESFRLHGETAQAKFLGKRPRQEQELLETGNRSIASELDGPRGTLLTNSIGSAASQAPLTITAGTRPHQQNLGVQMLQPDQGIFLPQHGNHSSISQPQSVAVASAAVNVTARPRVRARRGQATDPHSIAERLRRERIAERMKALQELVPNSNKTDKASMLDEIIDYVKFLQLQVKVLSMSRLGGAGAVAPLIADLPSKGAGSLISAGLGQAGGSLPESQDGIAFEQKVAKLMESNMTTAMQYLQNKGLCLMPIALATAISGSTGKPLLGGGSMKPVDSSDRQNSDMQPAVLPVGNCSTGVATAAFGNDGPLKEALIKKEGREEVITDKSVPYGLPPSSVPNVGLKK